MDYYSQITNRESIREYDPDRPVPKIVLERILNAGRIAPSASNRQPWELIIISSEKMLNKVRPSYLRNWFSNAPHILVVKGIKNKAWTRAKYNYNSIETDLTIAMDHMILAAEYEGLGTCWIAAFDPDILYAALNLNENELVFAISPLGYMPEGFKKKGIKTRKSFDEVCKFI